MMDRISRSDLGKSRRNGLQFSLRTLLVAVVITGLASGWFVEKYFKQRPTSLPILGPLTAGDVSLLPVPSDEEVLWAAKNGNSMQKPLPDGFVVSRIDKKLVESGTDPVRVVPMIGPCSLHHQVYQCRLVGQKNGVPEIHVFFVDLNHFHMVPAGTNVVAMTPPGNKAK